MNINPVLSYRKDMKNHIEILIKIINILTTIQKYSHAIRSIRPEMQFQYSSCKLGR